MKEFVLAKQGALPDASTGGGLAAGWRRWRKWRGSDDCQRIGALVPGDGRAGFMGCGVHGMWRLRRFG